MIDVQEIRAQFPALNQTVGKSCLKYFDSAASALKPNVMIDRIKKFYSFEASNVHRGAHFLSDRATLCYEEARRISADFINANAEEIIFTSGTTDSLNLLAYTLSEKFKTR